jgi:hypothetical protein
MKIMKILIVTFALFIGLINAQSLYYQRQKEHREGRAHPNQQRPQQGSGNQHQQNGNQYQNQYDTRQSNYRYSNGYRNINGQGLSIIRPGMYDGTTIKRALLTLQLTSYTNPNRWLPDGMQCYDSMPAAPRSGSGSVSGTQKTPEAVSNRDCMFTFTALITVPGGSITAAQTQEFLQLTAANGGNVDLTQTMQWSAPYQFSLIQKPSAINVMVLHSGNERFRNGSWPYKSLRYNVLVDLFYQNTSGDDPTMSTGMGGAIKLSNSELQTTLSLKYGITCLNSPSGQPYQGENCDLLCNSTATDSGGIICQSDLTGFYSVCKANGVRLASCTECVNGLSGDECNTIGGVMYLHTGISTGWRTIGIIFIVITAILAIILLGLIFFWWCTRGKDEKRTSWSQWPYARGQQEPPQPSPTRPAPPLPVKTSINGTGTGSRDPSYRRPETEQNPEWYQPNVVSVNTQRTAPLESTASHHSSQMGDDRGSESSYGVRNGRMTPRKEAAV